MNLYFTPELRCVEPRQPHSRKPKNKIFLLLHSPRLLPRWPEFCAGNVFCCTFLWPFFFKLSRSRPFSCNVLSWFVPTATFVHTAGGRCGSSTPIPHPFQVQRICEGHWKGSTSTAPTPTDGKSGKPEESVGIEDPTSCVSSEVTNKQSTAPDADLVAASESAPMLQGSHKEWRQSWWTPDRWSSDPWVPRRPRQGPSANATLLGGGG